MGSLMAEGNRLQGDMVGMMTHTPRVTETGLRRGTMITRQGEEEEVVESIKRREMMDGDQEAVEEGATERFLIFCLGDGHLRYDRCCNVSDIPKPQRWRSMHDEETHRLSLKYQDVPST